MKVDFARPDREHEAIRDALADAAARVLSSGRSILGDEVRRFEEAFAAIAGAPLAVGVSSGTDGLATALHALGVRQGDEVIVGAFGFVAAPEAVVRVGARPVFVDVEPMALALDAGSVAGALSSRTRAIISVDLFGMVHDLAPVRAAAPGVPVIEDAAQALGASLGTSLAGTLGDIGVHSFFPGKALGAAGDAGACVTGDPALAARMTQARVHGSTRTYSWETPGGNYRLDALQAAILGVKLPHLLPRLSRRRAVGMRLIAAARQAGVDALVGTSACSPMFSPLGLRVSGGRRDALVTRLREQDIDVRVHYPRTLAACPPFAAYAGGALFPEAERATRELLSIPCHPEMTDEEVTYLETALATGLR